MEENKRHIDDFLREELGDYSETPPPAVWDALEQRLDSPAGHKGFQFRRLWWIVPALLFIAGGTYLAAHKWSQPVRPVHTVPVVTDSASDSNFGPATNHTDTSFTDTITEKPAATPAAKTEPAAANTANTNNTTQPVSENIQPQAKNNTTGTTATNNTTADDHTTQPATHGRKQSHTKTSGNTTQTNNTVPAGTRSAGNMTTPAANTPADNNTDRSLAKNSTRSSARQKTKAAADHTTANEGNTSTKGADVTADNNAVKPQSKNSNRTSARQKTKAAANPTTANDGNTSTQGADVTADNNAVKPQSKNNNRNRTAANGHNTREAGDNKATNGEKPAPAENTAKTATTNNTRPTAKPQKATVTTQHTSPTVTTGTAAHKEAGQKTVAGTDKNNPATHRQKTPEATQHETPAANQKTVAAKNAAATNTNRPGRQQTPAATKNTTPAADKAQAAKPANTVAATARTKPTTKPVVPNAQPTQATNRPQTAPVHSGENGSNKEYSFKSKTAGKTADKPKDKLDLSDIQAAADTAEEKEMDPYASLNPPDDSKKRLHLEGGIKAAYTYGFNDFALNRISVLPYVQLNISTRLSVALHLGFSYGQMKRTDISGSNSYYNINPSLQVSSMLDTNSGQLDTIYTYRYTQLRDSFAVKYTTAKSLWEIEVPVMLKYNLSSSLSLFGGPVFTFGKVAQIDEQRSATYSRTIKDSASTLIPNQYNIAYFNNRNQPSGTPDSLFNNKVYENATTNPVRIGYTIGISYNTGGRLTADLSLQQMLTNPGFIPNESVRQVYTQPYIRLAVGFRIFK